MTDHPHPVAEFGVPGPLRDRLVAAILRGDKTATSSLRSEWESEGEALPRAGDRLTVVDSDGHAAATIELVAVEVIRLGEADDQLALDEGEGFASVADWREAHEQFWLARPLDDDTEVVVERFRVLGA